ARYDLPLHTIQVPGAWDVYDRAGRFFVHPATPEERRLVAWMLRRFKEDADRYVAAQGWVGMFWGMRAEESRRRRYALGTLGPRYETKSRASWTCCPLAWWSGRDVWAYLVTRDLPWLSRYDRVPGEQGRERQRSDWAWLCSEEVWRRGQGRAMREADPAAWQSLVARYPEVARWS
ncbi:MAG: phosphoadenosine phosphosulfate reductase family protein, partial [Myxococcales bacterium]